MTTIEVGSSKALLFEALAKAQGELPLVGKNNETKKTETSKYTYKYADIADVITKCAPILAKHGLAVIHTLNYDENGDYMETFLTHSSGEYLSSRLQLRPEKSDIKGFGSAITYLRRYSYAAMVGVAIGEDDDGNATIPEKKAANIPTIDKYYDDEVAAEESIYIRPDQLEQLDELLAPHPEIKDSLLLSYKIKTLNQVEKKQFLGILKHINRIVDTKLMR